MRPNSGTHTPSNQATNTSAPPPLKRKKRNSHSNNISKSNAQSKKQKTPGPPSINKTPARESEFVKKPFVHKYIRVRTGNKTNEIPSWLENIFNKK
jgi:hypothetical protein